MCTAAAVPDQASRLEGLHRDGDAGAADGQHDGQDVLREREFVAFGPVMCQEQPARQPFGEQMAAVAGGGPGYLRDQQLELLVEQAVQFRRVIDPVEQECYRDAVFDSRPIRPASPEPLSVTSETKRWWTKKTVSIWTPERCGTWPLGRRRR